MQRKMLTAIEVQLGKGNEVRLTGFGKFSVSRRKAREGRNPQTGESMRIAAKISTPGRAIHSELSYRLVVR